MSNNPKGFSDFPLVLGKTGAGKTSVQVEIIASAIIKKNTHVKFPNQQKKQKWS